MKISVLWFNTVLLLGLLALGAGCETIKKKDATTLHFHMEAPARDVTGRSQTVDIGRDGIFSVVVEKEYFLDEGHVLKASVVKSVGGGFQIMIEFNRRGTWILENYTTPNHGKRIAIYSEFGQARWLAAPTITKNIKDGVLTFTPDATKEEADRIVKGLNAQAKVLQKNNP